jgi:tetratricopeptide (TPR) repeat protein
MIEGRWDQAITNLDEAVDLRRQVFDYRRMAIALALSAEACERAGRLKAAAERYLQAGRSAALGGALSDAEKWLNNAVRLSKQSNDPGIAKEARVHLERLAQRSETARPDQQGSSGSR